MLPPARRAGPEGKAYGLGRTGTMLALANANKAKAGVKNVELLRGAIGNIPLPDYPVEVVISNCVINLPDGNDRALREAFRVLKPGGRFAAAGIAVCAEVPDQIRESLSLWIGCIAGALDQDQYRTKLIAAGFANIPLEAAGIDADASGNSAHGKIYSARTRAARPTV